MGTSHPETKPWSVEKIMSVNPSAILDVGAGSGGWLDVLRAAGYQGELDAIEVFEPYISKFKLRSRYNKVYRSDVRYHDHLAYDVVILGDVLEHMIKEDAVALMERVADQAKHAIIAIPIVHYHQGMLNNNPYEVHVKDDWSHEEVLTTFPNIVDSAQFTITGAYWLCYNSLYGCQHEYH